LNTIRLRVGRLAAAAGLGLAAILRLLSAGEDMLRVHAGPVGILALLSAGLLWRLIREYSRYKAALLIAENALLSIDLAVAEGTSTKSRPRPAGSVTAVISGFGILLGSEVIKFNADGITLRGIEYGPEFISFAYGAGGKAATVRIRHGQLDRRTLQDLAQKFRYETGVIISWPADQAE